MKTNPIPKIDYEAVGHALLSDPDSLRYTVEGDDSLLEAVKETTDIERALELYMTTGDCIEVHEAARTKLNSLCLVAIDKALEIKEIRDLHNIAPFQSESYEASLYKWIDIASTTKAMKELNGRVPYSDQKMRAALLDKWSSISLRRIHKSLSIKNIRKEYHAAPPIQKIRDAALSIWIETASTPGEIQEVCHLMTRVNDLQTAAFAKSDDICIAYIDDALRFSELRAVYIKTIYKSAAQKAAIIKAQELLDAR